MEKRNTMLSVRHFLLVVVVFLMACTTPILERARHHTYAPPTSAEGQACIQKCGESKQACERVCDPAANGCKESARQQARQDYLAYVSDQKSAGQLVMRDEDSFYNDKGCVKDKSCNCEQEYRACYKLCGGTVSSSLR
ncbi:MAG: hypothetical protein V3V61_04600 [Gammaproteobacteria bacterium]